jgi:hypothetical protein
VPNRPVASVGGGGGGGQIVGYSHAGKFPVVSFVPASIQKLSGGSGGVLNGLLAASSYWSPTWLGNLKDSAVGAATSIINYLDGDKDGLELSDIGDIIVTASRTARDNILQWYDYTSRITTAITNRPTTSQVRERQTNNDARWRQAFVTQSLPQGSRIVGPTNLVQTNSSWVLEVPRLPSSFAGPLKSGFVQSTQRAILSPGGGLKAAPIGTRASGEVVSNYTSRSTVSINRDRGQSGWATANTMLNVAGDLNTFAVRPIAEIFNGRIPDSRWVQTSKFAGKAFPVLGFGTQYMDNISNGYSPLVSGVGAGSSTLVPIAAGGLAGAAIGAPEGGIGALPGALFGSYIGYRYSDDINKSGLSTAEFIERRARNFDPTKIEDTNGTSLGDALNYWFMPKKPWIGK